MDFGLTRFDTARRTRRLELPEISADPTAPLTLLVAQLHTGNSRYSAWLITHAAPEPPTIPAEGTPERREYDDERTGAMLAAAAIIGWEGVLADSAPVDCTTDHATEFLRQLRAARRDVFVRVGNFCFDAANWTENAIPPTDPVALGKD